MKKMMRLVIMLSLIFYFSTTVFAADLAARGLILSINSAPNNKYELRMHNDLTNEEYTYLVSDGIAIKDSRPGHENQTLTWEQLASNIGGKIEVYLDWGSVVKIIYLGP